MWRHVIDYQAGGSKPVIIQMMPRKLTEEIRMNRAKANIIEVTKFDFPENTKIYINDYLSPHYKSVSLLLLIAKKSTSGKGWTRINHKSVLQDMFPT